MRMRRAHLSIMRCNPQFFHRVAHFLHLYCRLKVGKSISTTNLCNCYEIGTSTRKNKEILCFYVLCDSVIRKAIRQSLCDDASNLVIRGCRYRSLIIRKMESPQFVQVFFCWIGWEVKTERISLRKIFIVLLDGWF